MEFQDWTPVTVHRRYTKKEAVQKGLTTTQTRDNEKNERIRMAKLEDSDSPLPKKRVSS